MNTIEELNAWKAYAVELEWKLEEITGEVMRKAYIPAVDEHRFMEGQRLRICGDDESR